MAKIEGLNSLKKKIKEARYTGKATINTPVQVKWLSSGSLSIDLMTGGGFPRGRVSTIWGENATGKTNIMLIAAAAAVSRGERVVFFNIENTYSEEWAVRLGLDVDAVDSDGDPLFNLVSGTDAEETFQTVVDIVTSDQGKISLLIIDSIAVTLPKSVLNADFDKSTQMAARASMITRLMSLLTLLNEDIAVVIVNQSRDNIGGDTWAPKTKQTGGKAILFTPSLTLETMSMKTAVDGAGNAIAIEIRVKVGKNKAADFKKVVSSTILRLTKSGAYRQDIVLDTFVSAYESGLLYNARGTNWAGRGECYFKSIRLGAKKEEALDFMRENPEIVQIMTEEIVKSKSEPSKEADDETSEE